MKPVAVVVPTLRRPEALERALRSLAEQAGLRELVAEVVVVDNAPEASARPVVDRLGRQGLLPLRYVHERRSGVATARNAGVRELTAPYVAFLDDDETAPPDWLARLLEAHLKFGAAVTFGPVQTALPDPDHWAHAYLQRFFARTGPKVSGPVDQVWGCGNSIMTRAVALKGPEPFDVAADQTGGEDDYLFRKLRAEGANFAWAAEAFVFEHPPAERASLGYTLKRAFSYGQTPARLSADAHDWPSVAKWMAVGMAQTLLYGAAAGGLALVRRAERAEMADRAARGLGKLVWGVTPKFYGQAALAQSARAAAHIA